MEASLLYSGNRVGKQGSDGIYFTLGAYEHVIGMGFEDVHVLLWYVSSKKYSLLSRLNLLKYSLHYFSFESHFG